MGIARLARDAHDLEKGAGAAEAAVFGLVVVCRKQRLTGWFWPV